MDILEKLKTEKVLVSDGAWGTFIQKKGLTGEESPESWNLKRPDDILEVASSYVDAGADMILTNSFGGSPFKLQPYGLSDKTYEINKAAAAISKKAAGTDVFVLGSVGPTGKLLMMGEVSEEEMSEGFSTQIKGLVDGGADAILIETMSDMEEARVAIRAAKSICNKEIICTFTFSKTAANEYRTMMGTSPVEALAMMVEEGADIIGANCGNGMAGMVEIVREIREKNTSIPVLVHANAGLPVLVEGETHFPESPDEMAAQIRDLIEAGANIIGGCCGTSPQHISRIAETVKEWSKQVK